MQRGVLTGEERSAAGRARGGLGVVAMELDTALAELSRRGQVRFHPLAQMLPVVHRRVAMLVEHAEEGVRSFAHAEEREERKESLPLRRRGARAPPLTLTLSPEGTAD